jgi:hypothetical protein
MLLMIDNLHPCSPPFAAVRNTLQTDPVNGILCSFLSA